VHDVRYRELLPSITVETPVETSRYAGRVRTVAIILPGGRTHDRNRLPTPRLAGLRMVPFVRGIKQVTRGRSVAIWRLRYRYRGWNEPHRDPLPDLSWALNEVRERHPGATAVLVGHSMGGRVALWGAGDPAVTGVCALAPWIEEVDPVEQVAGRVVLIAHGDRDRVTDPVRSREFALRARRYTSDVRWVKVAGDGHAMLRRPQVWNDLVTDFVGDCVRGSDSP
jgi:predicted esterase